MAAEAAAVIAVIHRSLLLAAGSNGGGHITMTRKLVIFFYSFSLCLMYVFMPNAYYRYCGVHAQERNLDFEVPGGYDKEESCGISPPGTAVMCAVVLVPHGVFLAALAITRR